MTSYAACLADFLNRESGRVEQAYCYPVTKVQLVSLDTKTTRTFVPNEDGVWQEVGEEPDD